MPSNNELDRILEPLNARYDTDGKIYDQRRYKGVPPLAKQQLSNLIKEIIGEDYKLSMRDIETDEYRSEKQLGRNRIGAFQNLIRLEQRQKATRLGFNIGKETTNE